MSLRLTYLATAASIAFSTAAVAQPETTTTQTPPVTTQTTTTQTGPATTTTMEPATTQTMPGSTTQTTTQTPPTTTTTTPPATTQTMPSTTTQTTTQTQSTTTQPAAGEVLPATEADIKAGTEVYDQTGMLVGKVDSVSSKGAVVSTGKARAEIPLTSFGKSDKGLVVAITKAELDAQAKGTKAETKTETKTKTKTKTETKEPPN